MVRLKHLILIYTKQNQFQISKIQGFGNLTNPIVYSSNLCVNTMHIGSLFLIYTNKTKISSLIITNSNTMGILTLFF